MRCSAPWCGCFNCAFPQELGDDYLVAWDGFDDKLWNYLDENVPQEFLSERIDGGY